MDALENTITSEADEISYRIAEIKSQQRCQDQSKQSTCEDCGKEIAPERLETLPFCTTCINCQRAREASSPLLPTNPHWSRIDDLLPADDLNHIDLDDIPLNDIPQPLSSYEQKHLI